jgi:hypothetical protein
MNEQLAKAYEQEAIRLAAAMDVLLDRLAEIAGVLADSEPATADAKLARKRLYRARVNLLASVQYLRWAAETHQLGVKS